MARKRNSIVGEHFLITVQISHGKNTLHVRGQLVRAKLGLFNDYVYLVHPTAGLQSKTWSSTKYNGSKTWSTSSLLTSDLEKQDKHLSVSSYWTCVKKSLLINYQLPCYHKFLKVMTLITFGINSLWDSSLSRTHYVWKVVTGTFREQKTLPKMCTIVLFFTKHNTEIRIWYSIIQSFNLLTVW